MRRHHRLHADAGPDAAPRDRGRRSRHHRGGRCSSACSRCSSSPHCCGWSTTSLKSTAEVSQADLTFLPQDPTTEGYQTILGAPQTPVAQWFLNSMIAATAQTLLVLVVATMAAYALARLSFPGKRILTALVLATLFVPPISLLIPNYVIVVAARLARQPGGGHRAGRGRRRSGCSSCGSSSCPCRSSWRRRPCSTARAAGRSSHGHRAAVAPRAGHAGAADVPRATGTTSCGRCTCCSAPSG